MTFIMTNTHEEKEVFNEWQDVIVDPVTYDLEYYNRYVTDFDCFQLDEKDRKTAGIRLKEVFPKTVNPLEYSQSANNEILRLQVDFAFKEWIPLLCDPLNNTSQVFPAASIALMSPTVQPSPFGSVNWTPLSVSTVWIL